MPERTTKTLEIPDCDRVDARLAFFLAPLAWVTAGTAGRGAGASLIPDEATETQREGLTRGVDEQTDQKQFQTKIFDDGFWCIWLIAEFIVILRHSNRLLARL